MVLDYFGRLEDEILAVFDAFMEDDRNLIHLAFALITLSIIFRLMCVI